MIRGGGNGLRFACVKFTNEVMSVHEGVMF